MTNHLFQLIKTQQQYCYDICPFDLKSDDLSISTDAFDDYTAATTILMTLQSAIANYNIELTEIIDDDLYSDLREYADCPDAYSDELYAALKSLDDITFCHPE